MLRQNDHFAAIQLVIDDLEYTFGRDRAEKIAAVRAEIDAGTYETPVRLKIAVDRMIDDVLAVEQQDAERWDGMS